MKARTFDNLKFKKVRWIQIGITITLTIFSVMFLQLGLQNEEHLDLKMLTLAILCSGLVCGIGIEVLTSSLYIKKEKMTNI